jgi:glycogen synthase
MKILMLTWEYPPISYGGLARHVQDLSEAIAKQGHDIYIITQGDNNIPQRETYKGIKIIRTTPSLIKGNNFLDGIFQLNFQILEEIFKFREELKDIDIIHGHDWLIFWASKVLKHSLRKPLLFTIHATEYGRNQGIYNDMQRYINDLEWYATYEAWKVIVCSKYMESEIKGLFQIPSDKVKILENGVNPENYKAKYSEEFKKKYAHPNEKVVFFLGRIVREKGVQVLIQAIPEVLKYEPNTKFIIAGKGPFLDSLRKQADYLKVSDRIYFTGFISDDERNRLYRLADISVFPSLYEPFGIVALEAMVTKTPVIVSDVGGLSEFIKNGINGIKVEANNHHQLAEAIIYLIRNKEKAKNIVDRAYKMVVEDYSWDLIAQKTVDLYKEVFKEYKTSDWNKIDYKKVWDEDRLMPSYRYMV